MGISRYIIVLITAYFVTFAQTKECSPPTTEKALRIIKIVDSIGIDVFQKWTLKNRNPKTFYRQDGNNIAYSCTYFNLGDTLKVIHVVGAYPSFCEEFGIKHEFKGHYDQIRLEQHSSYIDFKGRNLKDSIILFQRIKTNDFVNSYSIKNAFAEMEKLSSTINSLGVEEVFKSIENRGYFIRFTFGGAMLDYLPKGLKGSLDYKEIQLKYDDKFRKRLASKWFLYCF